MESFVREAPKSINKTGESSCSKSALMEEIFQSQKKKRKGNIAKQSNDIWQWRHFESQPLARFFYSLLIFVEYQNINRCIHLFKRRFFLWQDEIIERDFGNGHRNIFASFSGNNFRYFRFFNRGRQFNSKNQTWLHRNRKSSYCSRSLQTVFKLLSELPQSSQRKVSNTPHIQSVIRTKSDRSISLQYGLASFYFISTTLIAEEPISIPTAPFSPRLVRLLILPKKFLSGLSICANIVT